MTTEGFTPAKYAFVIREVRKAQRDAWEDGVRQCYSLDLIDEEQLAEVLTSNPFPEES